jgi:allophanate hydrolase
MIPTALDLATLRAGYLAKSLTPLDVARETLARIAAYPDQAVWIMRVSESAVLARAEELAKLDPASLPLYGIPFAVKDNIDCAGLPTTAGCPAFSYVPRKNAPVVARLLQAGAILLGKTNLDQFATGLVGTRSPHGAPRCVFDADYVSGGSSSGSAVAVAAGLAAFALGTDTAGSGRVPAAFNNLIGLKPTRGLLSNSGVVPACKSLDCISIFANVAGDALEALKIAAGFDAADPYSRAHGPIALPAEGLRFGILKAKDREFFGDKEYAQLYDEAIQRLSSLGGTPVEFDYAPFAAAAALLYEGPWAAERLAAIGPFMEKHAADMDPTVRAILTGAKDWTAVDAFNGQYRLLEAKRAADAEWAKMDVMLLPTTPTQETVAAVNADPIARNARLARYTNFVNLLDYAAIAVPAGFKTNGLAFGVTLVGPAFSDASLAALADRLHREKPFGMGAAKTAALPEQSRIAAEPDDRVELFVVGAHLTGMPLNHELTSLGGVFRRAIKTAKEYRLFVLPNTVPPKPGMIFAPGSEGPGIAGEVWALPPEGFGRFTARIPAPLGIGKVLLEDGARVSGFLCEAYVVEGAKEITPLGGWRAYIKSLT